MDDEQDVTAEGFMLPDEIDPEVATEVSIAFDESMDGAHCSGFITPHSSTIHYEYGAYWVVCARCGKEWAATFHADKVTFREST